MACICSVHHLIVVVVLLQPVVFALQVHFTKQPADVTLKEGTPMAMASISCQVADLDTTSQIVSFERDNHIISDELNVRRTILDSLGLDSESYKVKLDINAGTLSRLYSLSVDAPNRNDTGRFRCVVCRRDTSNVACDANNIFASTDEIDLTVNYPPADYYPVCLVASSPVAEPNGSFVTVVEGESAQFACSSEIASPPVRITWFRDGDEVSEGTEVSDEDGIRVSRLDLIPTKEDNGTVFSCSATSDAYNETSRRCSLLPLSVASKETDDDSNLGEITSSFVIIIILAVVVVVLIVAIAVACFVKRKRDNRDSQGHKVEYQPAETVDDDDETNVTVGSKGEI